MSNPNPFRWDHHTLWKSTVIYGWVGKSADVYLYGAAEKWYARTSGVRPGPVVREVFDTEEEARSFLQLICIAGDNNA